MMLIPAIDLLSGKCVRLRKGVKNEVINYIESPYALAERYKSLGASLIHIVDLDGAFSGAQANLSVIKELAANFKLEVGGGIRSEESVRRLFDLGVIRVVLSTMLFKNPALAAKLKQDYRGKVLGSFDFKDGKVSYAGWTKSSSLGVVDGFFELVNGFREIVVTDTSRDGMLAGPNLELLISVKSRLPEVKIIAAGGVRGIADLEALEAIGIDGVIVGRALLEGNLPAEEALGRWGKGW